MLAAKSSAKVRAALRGPPLPDGMGWLWTVFLDLDRWRGAGGMGPAPLTLHDLAAYERRYGLTLSPDDADLLKRLDTERLAALHAK